MNFNRYADIYERDVESATHFARLPHDFFLEVKVAHLLGALREKFSDLSELQVLDVGSGIGLTDQRLKAHLPHLVGVDFCGIRC